MASVVKCFAIDGIDGYPVDIEIKTLEGQPMISIIGLGDQAVKEASERVQAAIDETGYIFPKKRVIISLAPSDKKKSGSHFDLAMAIGVLQQNEDMAVKNISEYGFIGELSLDGRLRACHGILPMIIAAQRNGIKKVIIPVENLKEAKLVQGVTIIGLQNLSEVVRFLEGKNVDVNRMSDKMEQEDWEKVVDLDEKSRQLLKETSEKYGYSARVIHKLLRLARTSADLAEVENIRLEDVKRILNYRDLDRSNNKMLVVN